MLFLVLFITEKQRSQARQQAERWAEEQVRQ